MNGMNIRHVITQLEQAEKVQQLQQQHPEMQQKYLDIQLRAEKRLLQKKVKEADEAKKAEEEKRERERKAADHQRSADDEGDEGDQQGEHINIKI